MFINRDEAERRIRDSKRILDTIVRQEHGSPISKDPLPSTQPEPESDGPSEEVLKDLLNVTPRRRGATMSTAERATVGLAGILLGGPAAGKLLDRGAHTSHELRHGYTSQENMYEKRLQDPALVSKLDEQRSRVRDLAFDRLTSAVGLITHEKLTQIKDVTKLSRVSRDLVTVVDKTSPKEAAIEGGLHFHVWKPEMKTEEQYEVINVNSPRD